MPRKGVFICVKILLCARKMKPKRFDRKMIEGYWVLRGKNREKAVTLGNDGRYMKSAVLATGVF